VIRFLIERIRGKHAPPGLRTYRDLTLNIDLQAARARTRDAIEAVLGANVYADDPVARSIDAGFGLVNQERLHVTFESVAAAATRVVIEARYPATLSRPERSRAVDALADALESGIRP
jgi:hypothetical protein